MIRAVIATTALLWLAHTGLRAAVTADQCPAACVLELDPHLR